MQYKLISGVFNCNTKCNQWVFIHCFFVNFFDISLLFNPGFRVCIVFPGSMYAPAHFPCCPSDIAVHGTSIPDGRVHNGRMSGHGRGRGSPWKFSGRVLFTPSYLFFCWENTSYPLPGWHRQRPGHFSHFLLHRYSLYAWPATGGAFGIVFSVLSLSFSHTPWWGCWLSCFWFHSLALCCSAYMA
mgnify:CR=1 FL=1